MRIGLSRSRHACTTASMTLTGFSNIVEDGFDAGVRLGESVENDMIAVRIGPDWRLVAVASAGYLKAHPKPKHPRNLLKHICIKRREAAGGHYVWEFGKNGFEVRVRIDRQVTFNDSPAMIDAAVQGSRIASVPEDMVVPLTVQRKRSCGRCVAPRKSESCVNTCTLERRYEGRCSVQMLL